MSLFGGQKTKSTVADKLGGLKIQSQGYGNVVPLIYGRGRVAPTLCFYSGFKAIAHVERIKKAGKGGMMMGKKKKPTATTWTYTAAIMLGISGADIFATGRLWLDKQIFETVAKAGLTVFNGYSSQQPWGYLSTYEPEKAVALRGFAYLAASNYPLSDQAGIGNHSVEVWGKYCTGADGDANPADIITDLLVNQCGIAYDKVTDLLTYRNYCILNDFLFSYVLDSQRTAGEIITELLEFTAAELVNRNGIFDIISYKNTGLDSGYALTYDDFIVESGQMPVKPTRSKLLDAFNTIKLEFTNRDTDYNLEISEAKEDSAIAEIGLRAGDIIKAPCITSAQTASNIANHLLSRGLTVRNTYKFSLSLRYIRLEPMDVVRLTDPYLGLLNLPVIIKKITITPEYLLEITAEDFAGQVYAATNYAVSTPGSYIPNTNAPVGNINPPVMFLAPAALTTTGYEVWCAISNNDPLYGGCDIHLSLDDGASYTYIGSNEGQGRMGVLLSDLAVSTDPDTTSTLLVDCTASKAVLSSVTQLSVDSFDTLSRVGREFIAYRDTALIAPSTYAITYLRRGLYGSTPRTILTGDHFVRCDDTLFKFAYNPLYQGMTIKLKFTAYNVYGEGQQDISTVPAYNFFIGDAAITMDSANISMDTTTHTMDSN